MDKINLGFDALMKQCNVVNEMHNLEYLLIANIVVMAILIIAAMYISNELSTNRKLETAKARARKDNDVFESAQKMFKQKKYEEIIEIMKGVDNTESYKSAAQYWIGRCYGAMGYWANANEAFRASYELDPINIQNIEPYMNFIVDRKLVVNFEWWSIVINRAKSANP